MPDFAHYRTILETRLAELDKRLHKLEDSLSKQPSKDWEESATEREGDEVREELGTEGLAEARKIHAALARMDEGLYGTCASCGDKISKERLDAIPYAALCRNCAA